MFPSACPFRYRPVSMRLNISTVAVRASLPPQPAVGLRWSLAYLLSEPKIWNECEAPGVVTIGLGHRPRTVNWGHSSFTNSRSWIHNVYVAPVEGGDHKLAISSTSNVKRPDHFCPGRLRMLRQPIVFKINLLLCNISCACFQSGPMRM
jgi:hypothetical protein